MKRQTRTVICSLSIFICVGTSLSLAQPAETDPAQAPATQLSPDASSEESSRKNPRNQPKRVVDIRINADALRSRLIRSISRTEKMLSNHKSALEKLDAGASAQEVLEAMRLDNTGRGTNPEQRTNPPRRPDDQNKPRFIELNPQERQELHQFINENFSDLSRNLEMLTNADPRGADRILTQLAPQIREVLMLRETEPELARIKIHDMQAGLNFIEASRKFRMTSSNPDANESQQADALAQLHDAAAQRFDAQLNAKQFEISKLEARLDELKSAVDHLESKRSEEIDRMIILAKKNASRHQMKSKQRRNQSNND